MLVSRERNDLREGERERLREEKGDSDSEKKEREVREKVMHSGKKGRSVATSFVLHNRN